MHSRLLKLLPLFLLALIALVLVLPGGVAAIGVGYASAPVYSLHPLETYNYTVVPEAHWGNLTMTSTADWLVLNNGTQVTGIPLSDDVGSYRVNLTLTNDTQVAYQNYTLTVLPSQRASGDYLVIAFIIGFAFVGVGFVNHRIWILTGVIWVYISLAVLYFYGVPWMVMGIGFALLLIIEGAFDEGGS